MMKDFRLAKVEGCLDNAKAGIQDIEWGTSGQTPSFRKKWQ